MFNECECILRKCFLRDLTTQKVIVCIFDCFILWNCILEKIILFVFLDLVKLLTNCLKLQEIKLYGYTFGIVSTKSLSKNYRPIPSPLLYEHAIAIIKGCKYRMSFERTLLNDFLNVFWKVFKAMFLFTLLYMPIVHVTILKYPLFAIFC